MTPLSFNKTKSNSSVIWCLVCWNLPIVLIFGCWVSGCPNQSPPAFYHTIHLLKRPRRCPVECPRLVVFLVCISCKFGVEFKGLKIQVSVFFWCRYFMDGIVSHQVMMAACPPSSDAKLIGDDTLIPPVRSCINMSAFMVIRVRKKIRKKRTLAVLRSTLGCFCFYFSVFFKISA